MATGKILFASLTVPTPEPFDRATPTKQQENFFYVMNQIFAELKANSEEKLLNPSTSQTVNVDLTELVKAVQDLTVTGETLTLPALGITLTRIGKTLTAQF